MKSLFYVGEKYPSPGEWYLIRSGNFEKEFSKAVIQFKRSMYPCFIEVDFRVPPGAEVTIHEIDGDDFRLDAFNVSIQNNTGPSPSSMFDEWNW